MNDVFESRIGSIFVIVFAAASIIMAAISYFCTSIYCKLLIVVPILPWATLLERQLHISIPWATYPLFLLFNAIIVYCMGVFVELAHDRYARRA